MTNVNEIHTNRARNNENRINAKGGCTFALLAQNGGGFFPHRRVVLQAFAPQ